MFSVLLSVYHKENPEFLRASLDSIFSQTLLPDEVVLVKDGSLTNELDSLICEFAKKFFTLKVVELPQNAGLGRALNEGLKHCSYDIVARMDTDDICKLDRFEKQIAFIQSNPNICLCSGYINEFIDNPSEIASIRKVPETHNEIVARLKQRNAFNHMAVCFRKSAVQVAGGYLHVPFFEDYDLWVRIVQKGYVTHNLQEVLVNVRIGNDMIGRRHGWEYSKHEYSFLKRQFSRKFIGFPMFLFLIVTRIPIRIMPKYLLRLVYKVLRR